MKKVEVSDELLDICNFYEKKYGRGGSFSPFKYYKKANSGNSSEPVYYIGVPGMSVAIAVTLMSLCTIYVISLKFAWWLWIFYILAWLVIMRIAMKIDKVKQVRFMAFSLSKHAINSIKKSAEVDDADEQSKLLDQAKDFLTKAYNWVEEPAMKKQLDLIEEAAE